MGGVSASCLLDSKSTKWQLLMSSRQVAKKNGEEEEGWEVGGTQKQRERCCRRGEMGGGVMYETRTGREYLSIMLIHTEERRRTWRNKR